MRDEQGKEDRKKVVRKRRNKREKENGRKQTKMI
jgi:hypothetical protein